MKIDILEAYVWISEVFRVKSGFFRSTGELREYEEEVMGLMGQVVEERRQGARPP